MSRLRDRHDPRGRPDFGDHPRLYPQPPPDWIVETRRGECASVHRLPEPEARRLAQVAASAGMHVVGPRPATEIEAMTPMAREALLRKAASA